MNESVSRTESFARLDSLCEGLPGQQGNASWPDVASFAEGAVPKLPADFEPAHLRAVVDCRLALLVPSGPRAPRLNSAMRYALLAPGKRFRPLLAILAARQCGSADLEALDPACALEMVHAASLILDDLPCMDDAELRRGLPTVHRHYGEDIAILAAIGLLNRAYGLIAACTALDADCRAELIATLSEAIGPRGLIGGQEADLRDRRHLRDAEEIGELYYAKTGLLLETSVELGAMVAGAPETERRAMKRFARQLGLAFQTIDDLIDALADPGEAPKDVRKDCDKPTMIDLVGVEGARIAVTRWIDEACDCLCQLDRGPDPLAGFARQTLLATLQR